MGANAQTSVPTFTAGEVLTAANMNISARTGVPVFADTTARDAAFGGTGEKTLAEGQMAYVENLTGDAQIQYYDGTTWNSLGAAGLTLISSTTIGTSVASVAVTGVFSSTYENYEIILSGGVLAANNNISFQLGATTTGYYAGYVTSSYAAGTVAGNGDSNAASWTRFGLGDTTFLNFKATIFSPFSAKNTAFVNQHVNPSTTGYSRFGAGFLNNTTSYTDFTIASGSNFTGGTIKVYGYRN